MTDIEKELTRLKNLKQNKKRSLSELEKEAKINVFKKQIDIASKFKNPIDQEEAEKIFDHYIQNYNFDTFVDYKKLADLVYEEILLIHLKQSLDKVNDDDSNHYINNKDIQSLHDTQERIYFLQEKLGIVKTDKKDDLSILEQLRKKFDVYIPFNRNEFTCIAENSLVLMADLTSKKIQDINIGDEILGLEKKKYSWKLKKQRVLNKSDNGVKEVIKIRAGNNELELTPDHEILAASGYQDNRGTEIKFFEASKSWGRKIKIFNHINNIEDYYKGVLLGLIDSDGWVRKDKKCNHSYSIAQKNEYKAVEWVLKHLNINFSKRLRRRFISKKTILKTKKKFFACFEYHISIKFTKFIDDIYIQLGKNKDISFGYIAGFTIGDGSLDNSNSWRIYQSWKVNQHKIDRILNIFNVYKISYNFNKDYNIDESIALISFGSSRIPMLCPESKKFSTWYKKFIQCQPFYSLDWFKLKFVDVEQQKNVWDLTTETGNFIVNGFVVHNCWIPTLCPECGHFDVQGRLFRRRVKDFDCLIHPAFAGRFLYNYEIINDVKNGKITSEQAAKYLRTSPKYIEWAIENEHKIIPVEGVEEERLKAYVDANPNLRDYGFYNQK